MRRILGRVAICFSLSSTTGLLHEVLWIRMMGLIFSHTVFARHDRLHTAFMTGLALCSNLFGRLVDRSLNAPLLCGLLEGGIGLYCLAIPPLIALVERLYLTLYQGHHFLYSAFSPT